MKRTIYLMWVILGLCLSSAGCTEDNSTSLKADQPADKMVSHDGLYVGEYLDFLVFFRFYERRAESSNGKKAHDGIVFHTAVLKDPQKQPAQIAQEVARWFNKRYPAERGFYKIEGSQIVFAFVNYSNMLESPGTITHYLGEIKADSLELTGRRFWDENNSFFLSYRFVPVAFDN